MISFPLARRRVPRRRAEVSATNAEWKRHNGASRCHQRQGNYANAADVISAAVRSPPGLFLSSLCRTHVGFLFVARHGVRLVSAPLHVSFPHRPLLGLVFRSSPGEETIGNQATCAPGNISPARVSFQVRCDTPLLWALWPDDDEFTPGLILGGCEHRFFSAFFSGAYVRCPITSFHWSRRHEEK